MNIRNQVRKAIAAGSKLVITARGGRSGVIFPETQEFVPFSRLGYFKETGFVKLWAEGNPSETETDNPETIHLMEREGEPDQWYVWMDEGGFPHLLGDLSQAADLYQALADLLLNSRVHPEKISEFDPAWGTTFTMAEAVQEAQAFGWRGRYLADRIRQAAEERRIKGCGQDTAGRWYFNKRTFRHWLADENAHKRGRKPKKEVTP